MVTNLITDEMLKQAATEYAYAFMNMYPDDGEYDHVFSERFNENIKKVFRIEKRYYAHRALKRVACFALAFILVAAMFVSFNPSIRAAVADWVKETFNGVYHYFFVGEDTESTEGTASTGEPNVYRLDWLPDGYILMDSFAEPNGKTYLYLGESGDMLQFFYMHGTQSDAVVITSVDYVHKYISEENLQAEIFLALNESKSNVITWTNEDGNIFFMITGFVEEEDLVEMATNVVIAEND